MPTAALLQKEAAKNAVTNSDKTTSNPLQQKVLENSKAPLQIVGGDNINEALLKKENELLGRQAVQKTDNTILLKNSGQNRFNVSRLLTTLYN